MDTTFFFGDCQVDPKANTIRFGKQQIPVEPKAMDVLVFLCRHAGEVLSAEQITQHCWPDVTGDNPLHKTITALRKALGDSATNSVYIETIRKRGYRTLAPVRFPVGQLQLAPDNHWQQGSPFPGLQAFNASQAQVFFGRGKAIEAVLQAIARQVNLGRAFCLVLGPSGSGKSSLIQAGVLPNLQQETGYNGVRVLSASSLDLADVAPGRLLTELASVMLDWELDDKPVFVGESTDSLAEKLAFSSEQVLYRCQAALKPYQQHKSRLALFIDRLEVLLASPQFSADERQQLVNLLDQLAQSGAVLVLSACRNEFYPELATYPALMVDKQRGAHFDLAPPSTLELQQMIRQPALAAGLSWQTDPVSGIALDEQLCNEAADNPDGLPMLQYLLQQLYLQRSSDNQLLWAVYEQLGGIEGAIGQTAEQVLSELSSSQQAALPTVLSLLVTLRDDEQVVTSRSAPWSALQNTEQQQLVQALVNQRLLVSHLDDNNPSFSIAHEALLRRWPRASDWIAAHYQALAVKSRLVQQSKRWQQEQQQSAYLLAEGKPLQEAQWVQAQGSVLLEPDIRRYIQASASKANNKRWARRGLVLLLSLLTLVAVLMSLRSFQAEKDAQQKRLAAENLVGFMVGGFADKLRQIGRMDLLDGISNKALQYFTDFTSAGSGQYLSLESRLLHGQTLEAMGEVAYSRGKTDEATTALLAAREQLTAVLAQQPNNLSLLKTLGANAFWLGQMKYDVSDWAKTLPYFTLYHDYSARMYQLAPNDLDAIMEFSYATNSLGSVAMKQQQFDLAEAYFQQSLELKLKAQQLSPDHKTLVGDIADTRSWLAGASMAKGDLRNAITEHRYIQGEFEQRNNEAKVDPYVLERAFNSYEILSTIYTYQGLTKDAIELLYKAHELLGEALSQDPQNQGWQNDFFNQKIKLMVLNAGVNDLRINYTPELLKNELEMKRNKFSNERHYRRLKNSLLMESINYYFAKGLRQKGTELVPQAVAIYRQLYADDSENQGVAVALAEAELLAAFNYKQQQQLKQRQESCTRAKELLAPLQQKDKKPHLIQPYATALKCLNELDQHSDVQQLVQQSGLVLGEL
ncbi:winged helix-turn-helix domain-containing protein [Rheinheimera marina]|uniref:Winged helix-turn-helix domain-containing protein n=1 Tax=Rheinheimera marina TaxID=1774958 RepID=A0ABV9JMS6_9GAMM